MTSSSSDERRRARGNLLALYEVIDCSQVRIRNHTRAPAAVEAPFLFIKQGLLRSNPTRAANLSVDNDPGLSSLNVCRCDFHSRGDWRAELGKGVNPFSQEPFKMT